MATVMTPSKKRYDRQALEQHNRQQRYGNKFYTYHAADLREIMNLRYRFVKNGWVEYLPKYFSAKKKYKEALMEAVAIAYRLPLPG